MKTKMLVLATAMMFASLANECQAQSNPCGAASFTFYGNFQNQQVRLYFIGVDGNLYNTLANNLAGNYADPQAAYLYNVVANNSPIASVIEQIVVNSNGIPQDGPNTFASRRLLNINRFLIALCSGAITNTTMLMPVLQMCCCLILRSGKI